MRRTGQEQVLVHAVGEQWRWALVDGQGRVTGSGQCRPGSPDWPRDRSQTVLIDASRTVGLRLDLPDLPPHRLDKALRWAAEEHLAAGAEDEHVVAGPRDEQGRLCCLVIGRAEVTGIADRFEGQSAESMVPDALCLPWQAGQVSLAAVGDRVLARWGSWEFGSFETELAGDLVPGLLAGGESLHWYGGEYPDWLDRERVVEAHAGRALEAMLVEGAASARVNLLSGPFSPRSAVSARSHWRWAAGLAVALAGVALATAAVERHQLARQADSLQAEIEQRFGQIFPEVGRVVRPREQAERELARLRFGQAAGLLDLLSRTAPVIEGQPQLVLDSLNYRDGVLEVSLRAPDVAALDQLEQRLRALDLAAEVRSASLDEEGASGRIRVGQGGR